MKEKTLIIFMGSARGGKHAMLTQEKYFIDHLDADLALCLGDIDEIDDFLINKAKYNWNFKDFENWREYFEEHFSKNIFENLSFGKDSYLMGGIDSYNGSGAIIFAIRDILLRNHIDVIESYSQVILTRSDYIYVNYHQDLDKDNIWAIEGEDYFGITDRHYVFPGKDSRKILGICNYLDKKNIYKDWSKPLTPEVVLMFYFKDIGIFEKIKRFKRTQMSVKKSSDSTTTREGFKLFLFNDLYAKKIGEFENAMKQLNFFDNPTNLNLRLKINFYLFQLLKMINTLTFKILKKRFFTQ